MVRVSGAVVASVSVSAAVLLGAAAADPVDPLAFVDTRIGTGGLGWGVGGQNPGAQVPYGACRAGPDSSSVDNVNLYQLGVHYGGYWYHDTHIRAFSHTHLVGAGVGDWGNVGVMPVLGPVAASQVAEPNSGGWAARFDHATETAEPGHYAVDLELPLKEDGGHELLPAQRTVHAEVTATTTHAAFHRYTFPATTAAGQAAHPAGYSLLVDACHTASIDVAPLDGSGMARGGPPLRDNNKQACRAAAITVDGAAQSFAGWVDNAGGLSERSVNQSVRVFFFAEATARCSSGTAGGATAVPAVARGAWADFVLLPAPPAGTNTTSAASTNASGSAGAFLTFPPTSDAVACGGAGGSGGNNAAEARLAVEVGVGISFVSADGAWANLQQAKQQLLQTPELPSPGLKASLLRGQQQEDQQRNQHRQQPSSSDSPPAVFDAAREAAQAQWRAQLGVVAVDSAGADPDKLTQFYSSLYRASLSPTTYSEVVVEDDDDDEAAADQTKVYLGFDGLIHAWPNASSSGGSPPADDGASSDYYSDMSLWDIHRTQLPWLVLTDPARARDVARSLVQIADDAGHIPRWPLANVYTGCMIGDHGFSFLADACVKGVRDVNFTSALEYMRATGMGGGNGGQRSAYGNYSTLGYVTEAEDETAAPLTLSYAFDDASIGRLAQCLLDRGGADPQTAAALKNTSDFFSARSGNYATQWEASRRLLCPRDVAGNFLCPPQADVAVPYPLQEKYLEGDAAQWVWFVPHAPDGLRRLFPDNATYLADLEAFFNKSTTWALPNTVPNPWYWAGNEPDLLAPWQFSFAAGGAARTQYWTRWLLDHKYTSESGGVPGNDDFGTMSAWAVFASLGLYPMPGTTTYFLGSPVFPSAVVHLGEGAGPGSSSGSAALGPINVTAHDVAPGAVYVARASVNGEPVDLAHSPFVDHSSIARAGGATLEFWMTAEEPTYV